MARRKKRRRRPGRTSTRKNGDIFNPALKEKVTLAKEEPSDTPLSNQGKTCSGNNMENDEKFFHKAMEDVVPLSVSRQRILTSPRIDIKPAHPAPDDDLEAITQLSELVSGSSELDITFSDEYIEGSLQGFSPKLMQRLKRGQFPIQNYIDLHGLTKQDAQIRVRDFILESYRAGLRCVLVVHGRGLNSENNIPILKERLPHWLTRGPARKIVLAFSTAKPYDGGTGALYILLRKRKGVS